MILMEHIDKSDDIRMLKGTEVTLHSLDLHLEDERNSRGHDEYILQYLPNCIYVVKENATLTLRPSKTCGLYPSRPTRAVWYLDRGRPRPTLDIQAPGWAVRIISLQGGKEDALINYVQASSTCSLQTCYVALSRTMRREPCA